MNYKILQGNNVDVLKTFPDNHFDSIVTDPPYGIDFLGKSWDANTGSLATYQECLRVLKPGGHILAFSAARTYHHLAITIEQAGFEIRDQIMWIYSSGFPKSQDVGRQLHKKTNGKPDKQRFDPAVMIKEGNKFRNPTTDKLYTALPDINGDKLAQSHEGKSYGTVYEEVIEVDSEWSGWGTQLKPAHEPIVLARKPLAEKNIAANCQKYGTGAINIDATRVAYEDEADRALIVDWKEKWGGNQTGGAPVFQDSNVKKKKKSKSNISIAKNCQEWGVGAINIDATRIPYDGPDDKPVPHGGKARQHKDNPGWMADNTGYGIIENPEINSIGRFPSNVLGEIPDYQKYFYCPKVSRKERHIGFDELPKPDPSGKFDRTNNPGNANERIQDKTGNNHPTVKPIELMKYLIKLITPPGGKILDPFNGSGSTGCAAVELDYEYTGIELDANYVAIANKRIEAWYQATHNNTFNELFTEEE